MMDVIYPPHEVNLVISLNLRLCIAGPFVLDLKMLK
jgi:hypothetical protein